MLNQPHWVPAKNAQKDKDARWTKKNDESFYGYKNHVGVDKAYKLIRKWDATDAAVHDSQKLDAVLDLSNTGKEVWADSAHRSVQSEACLKEKDLQSRIHRRAGRNLVEDAVRVRAQQPRSLQEPHISSDGDRRHNVHCQLVGADAPGRRGRPHDVRVGRRGKMERASKRDQG